MKFYLSSEDYTLTREQFQLMHDLERDMLVTEPQPENLAKYYESQDYISHTDAKDNWFEKMYQAVKGYNLDRKLALITSYAGEKKSLLDVGAGTGDFLALAKKHGWETDGVEPSDLAKAKAAEKGLTLYSDLKALPEKKYELITLWHVLEHLPNLEEQIQELVGLLSQTGTLVIAVPNFKSFDAAHYKKFWAAYDVPRHLWHFSRHSIRHLFSTQGMEVVKTKPMIFDAFYVSLLSEKYKSGKQNPIKAFLIGLWSNLSAMRTKEYSSLIYVLKRS
ncbi:Methyltransferase domain-containing protein [Arenibacter nanhaiticus]|uniref:Methyltransferase domain-containing protein n=1 Tax=Arenibacter nanhaiticus TaxID=558155 RepID=A0A1M6A0I5_9FLAO|nr:class I SAM-dependent methyltransferase [Arenibacter nanhaiticus]SHI30032.1 Methyltransferase domain-containing protein [Arenibacter nanhaiticus]